MITKRRESRLSARELTVLRRLSFGEKPEQIGTKLDLATNTVETYIERAKSKLKAKSRTHAVSKAMRLKLMK